MTDGDASSSNDVASEPNPESQWHMLVNDESSGPYSTADMATWFKSGDISPELWVSENGAEWRQAKEFFSGTGGDRSASADPQPAAPEADGGVAMTVPANDSWYMLVNDEQHGPYTAAQLRQWMESGDIDSGTWVSNGGQWAAARDALP